MDPSVMKFFKNNNSKIIYGGDFVQDINNSKEIEDFLDFNINRDYVLIPGNHDVGFNPFKHQENRYKINNKNLFIYLNTNFKSENEINKSVDFIKKTIQTNNFNNILIFSHQLFFSKSDYDIRTNSRDHYINSNKFYDKIHDFLNGQRNNVYIYSGDIGAFKYIPYAYYHKFENITYLSTGLGNGSHNFCIEISINQNGEINNSFIDLDTREKLSPLKFLRWKVKLYQLPKLFLFFVKQNYWIIILIILVFLSKVIIQIIPYKTPS
jgi:hypothetical protein